jgi:hypothetical protein
MKEALKTAMLVSKAGNAFFQVGVVGGWGGGPAARPVCLPGPAFACLLCLGPAVCRMADCSPGWLAACLLWLQCLPGQPD